MNVHIRKLKQTLTSDQIILLLKSLDSDVYKQNKNEIIFYSCCHHLDSIRHKPKLYYYFDGLHIYSIWIAMVYFVFWFSWYLTF